MLPLGGKEVNNHQTPDDGGGLLLNPGIGVFNQQKNLNVPLNTAAGTVQVGDREVTFLLEIFAHLDFLCFGALVYWHEK